MKAVVQRVLNASVLVEQETISSISMGMLILLGIQTGDAPEDIEWLANKISNLRIFPDENGVMNLSVVEAKGKILVISQFTLQASTKKGNRPSYILAAEPIEAEALYLAFNKELSAVSGISVQTGQFGAMMAVTLVNDGPVTIIIDTKNKV